MSGNKRWSEKEIQDLRKHYQGTSIDDIVRILPNRSKASIHKKASDLGISFKWDERNETIALLKDVLQRLERIELIVNNRSKRQTIWSKQDIDLLTDNYQTLSDFNISQLLSNGATRSSVQSKRLALGLTKKRGKQRNYDSNLERYIIKHFPEKRAREISETLELQITEVNDCISKLKREKKLGFIYKK